MLCQNIKVCKDQKTKSSDKAIHRNYLQKENVQSSHSVAQSGVRRRITKPRNHRSAKRKGIISILTSTETYQSPSDCRPKQEKRRSDSFASFQRVEKSRLLYIFRKLENV